MVSRCPGPLEGHLEVRPLSRLIHPLPRHATPRSPPLPQLLAPLQDKIKRRVLVNRALQGLADGGVVSEEAVAALRSRLVAGRV